MEISGKTLKITVKAGFKSNTATLSSNNVKSIPSTSIKIDSLGYSTEYDECVLIVLIVKMVNAKFVVHEIVIKMMELMKKFNYI